MKKTFSFVITLLMLMSGMVVMANESSSSPNSPGIPSATKNTVLALTSHGPIRINGDMDFASRAASEGWKGTGRATDPYIIENYDINGTGYGYCIYIGNTTVSFVVQNCYLHHASGNNKKFYWDSGLVLYNVRNGMVTNNTISSNNRAGIYLHLSGNNIIRKNEVSSNYAYGIFLQQSSYNAIEKNNIIKNGNGLFIQQSIYNAIEKNNITKNWYGIFLQQSIYNIISRNNITNNKKDTPPGWSHVSPIVIQNNIGETLTDYQIKIELNSSNFDFSRAKSDGSDIRFTLSGPLPYWIESWDKSNKKATIWVKVPSLPANSQRTIYMYYGNPSASSNADGGSTFELFDDFVGTAGSSPNPSKWTAVKKGSSDAVVELDGNGNLHLAGETDTISSGNVKSLETFTNGFSIRAKRKYTNDYYVDVSIGNGNLQDYDDGGTSKWWFTAQGNGYVWGQKGLTYHFIGKTPAGAGGRGIDIDHNNSWGALYTYEINDFVYDSDGNIKWIHNGVEIVSGTDTTYLSSSKYLVLSQGEYSTGLGGDSYYDWIFVRKYVSPEPKVTVLENGYGIYLKSSRFNTIYHNNFINNRYQAYDNTGNNRWNESYPVGGNYWSDYSGIDHLSGPNQNKPNLDGIGDTPYTNILGGGGARDYYPLIAPILEDTPPEVVITSPSDGAILTTSNVMVSWSGYDSGSGINHYEVRIGQGEWKNLGKDISYMFTGLPDGKYTVYVRAVDNSMNARIASANFTVDTIAPDIRITSPPEGEIFNSSSVAVSWNGSDETSGIDHYEIRIDTSSWIDVGLNTTYTFTGLPDRSHTVYVKAVDNGSNDAVASVNFTVDATAPVIRITAPFNGAIFNRFNVKVSWNATDETSGIDHYEISIDSGSWINVGLNTSYTFTGLSDGSYLVKVKAVDNVGNVATDSITFIVDTTPPQITITSPASGAILNSSSITVSWNGSDETSGIDHYEISIDSGSWVDVGLKTSYTFENLKEGKHTMTVRAYDLSNNRAEITANFTLDLTPPVITVQPFREVIYPGETLTINFSATDNMGVREVVLRVKYLGGIGLEYPYTENFTGLSFTFPRFNTTGTHVLQIFAWDLAGNTHSSNRMEIRVTRDGDGDGMDDRWEREHGLDPQRNDGSEDPDEDDLTNLQEFLNGTDPKNRDTDGDGYWDGEEVKKGYDPLDSKSHPVEKKYLLYIAILIIVIIAAVTVYMLRRRRGGEAVERVPGEQMISTAEPFWGEQGGEGYNEETASAPQIFHGGIGAGGYEESTPYTAEPSMVEEETEE